MNVIGTVSELQELLQNGFGGVLLVLLGMELIETVKAYAHEHHVRLEIVFVMAMIAVAPPHWNGGGTTFDPQSCGARAVAARLVAAAWFMDRADRSDRLAGRARLVPGG